jgi:hypothetical protein
VKLPSPKRRWFQFSLLSLLGGTAVLGGLFGRIAYLDRMARFHERESIAYLTVSLLLAPLDERGIKLGDEGERHFRLEERYRRAMWYPWLLVDEKTDIGVFTFPDRTISDDDLPSLASRTQLVELDLSGTKVTDAGIAHLSSLRNLSDLWLKNTCVTDAGVRRLQESLPNVKIHR